ncbi:uncharacterized [Tachysurus ichikawai]
MRTTSFTPTPPPPLVHFSVHWSRSEFRTRTAATRPVANRVRRRDCTRLHGALRLASFDANAEARANRNVRSGAAARPRCLLLPLPLTRLFSPCSSARFPGPSVLSPSICTDLHRNDGAVMSEYSAVPPPPGAAAAAALGPGGVKKDAFADAVQRARQVRESVRASGLENTQKGVS